MPERSPARVLRGLLVVVVPAVLARRSAVMLLDGARGAPRRRRRVGRSELEPAALARGAGATGPQATGASRRRSWSGSPPRDRRRASSRFAPAGGELVVPPVDRVGWVRGGPRPGEPGRTVLIGHRDSQSGAAPFAGLASLRPGRAVVTVARDPRTRTA